MVALLLLVLVVVAVVVVVVVVLVLALVAVLLVLVLVSLPLLLLVPVDGTEGVGVGVTVAAGATTTLTSSKPALQKHLVAPRVSLVEESAGQDMHDACPVALLYLFSGQGSQRESPSVEELPGGQGAQM